MTPPLGWSTCPTIALERGPARKDTAPAMSSGVTRTEHIAEWWIAFRAHDLLTGRSAGLAPRPARRQAPGRAVR